MSEILEEDDDLEYVVFKEDVFEDGAFEENDFKNTALNEDVFEDGDLMETKLYVKGDIMIKRTLLIPKSQDVDTNDVDKDDNNVVGEEDGDDNIVADDVNNGGEDGDNTIEMVSTQQIIKTIGTLLNQESTLINGRYSSLNDFCDGIIKYFSQLQYLKQHLNNYYFQDRWSKINKNTSVLSNIPIFKQRMTITILPSLGIFDCEYLFKDNGSYIEVGKENLFQEISAVGLLPGIYVYDFRHSTDTDGDDNNEKPVNTKTKTDTKTKTKTATKTDKVIKFKYTSAESVGKFEGTKEVNFEPYTLYYIKQENTSNETIPGENIIWSYKCVVMMSGIDSNAGPNTTTYTNLTSDQIYYEEYYVDETQLAANGCKKAHLKTAKVFNNIIRTKINITKIENNVYNQQPTIYWSVNEFEDYDAEFSGETLNQQPSVILKNFVKGLKSGDIGQWTLFPKISLDGVGQFMYIFKLSDNQYLIYNAAYTYDNVDEPEQGPKTSLTLTLKTVSQPTVYYLDEIQVAIDQDNQNNGDEQKQV